MKRIASFFVLIQIALFGAPAFAQAAGQTYENARIVTTHSWVEEWDPVTQRWVQVGDDAESAATAPPLAQIHSAARYAKPAAPRVPQPVLAQYGPFVITSATSAAIIGSTDAATPAYFDAMLRDFPHLATLQMIEAPGTSNDIANLEVGRRIREAGIATHVPNGGSVRSGAVELFLAGATRTVEQGAQFAVHSWLDNHGREADDLAEDHPAHRLYIDYYVEMGMSEDRAREFYAMTNSVPHSGALWLGSADMLRWLPQERVPSAVPAAPAHAPVLAHVSLELGDAALMTIADLDWKSLAEPIALPVVQVPELDYVDLSAINLAQLELDKIA